MVGVNIGSNGAQPNSSPNENTGLKGTSTENNIEKLKKLASQISQGDDGYIPQKNQEEQKPQESGLKQTGWFSKAAPYLFMALGAGTAFYHSKNTETKDNSVTKKTGQANVQIGSSNDQVEKSLPKDQQASIQSFVNTYSKDYNVTKSFDNQKNSYSIKAEHRTAKDLNGKPIVISSRSFPVKTNNTTYQQQIPLSESKSNDWSWLSPKTWPIWNWGSSTKANNGTVTYPSQSNSNSVITQLGATNQYNQLAPAQKANLNTALKAILNNKESIQSLNFNSPTRVVAHTPGFEYVIDTTKANTWVSFQRA